MNTPPPGFAQYPRPQGLPSGVRSLPPGAHTEAIGDAWNLFQRDWSTWVASTLIFLVIYIVFYIPTAFLANFLEYGALTLVPAPGQLPSPVGILEAVVAGIIPMAVICTLGGGMFLMALKQIRGQSISVGDLFSAVGKVPKLLGAYILFTLLVIVGCIACIIPGLWVSGAFSLTPFLILDQDQGAVQALGSSYRAAGTLGMGFSMFGLLFLLGIITWLGVIPCGLGLLATVPIYIIAMSIHYFYFFPEAFAVPQPPMSPHPAG